MNNNNNKQTINNFIRTQWVLALLVLINSFYSYILLLFLLFVFLIFRKYFFIFLLIPATKYYIYKKIYPSTIKTNGIIYYSVKSICKKNTYLIKIHKTENTNKIKFLNKKLGVFLYSKSIKDYFFLYKSQIYIINENFLLESQILQTYKNPYKQLLEKIYNKILYFSKYGFIINSLLLSIKDNSKDNKEIYKLFKETGTWHLLCIGGLHIHILKKIIDLIIRILFEISLYINFQICGLRFLKIANWIELIFISLYGFINGTNSNSVPTIRGVSSYIIFNFFYLNNTIINHLWIFLIIIWTFLFINGNYIYDLGFQMSFLSVYFLMGFSKILYRYHQYILNKLIKLIGKKVTFIIDELINLFIINCFIGIILIGFSFYLHKSFNIGGLLANVIIIPIFYIIIILNFLGLINVFFWKINDVIIKQVIKLLNIFNNNSFNIYFNFNKNQLLIYVYGVFLFISILILLYNFFYYLNNNPKKLKEKYFID